MEDLFDTTDATGLATAIARGDVSAREVVELALRRVESRNPTLNAVVELRAEQALEEAARASGPLAGVPFVVKDLGVGVAGMRSTSGSRLRADVVATDDSTIVQRYRQAGLVIIGTTNTPEFGRSPSTEPLLHGPTRNPHALDRSAGGSSGGTAAAIAGGMVPAGHGNDGGGSIRIPASACGLVGLKPSRGRVPAQPKAGAFAYPMGINHALTRSVRDSALLLDVVSGAVPGQAYGAVVAAPDRGARVRIALSTTQPNGSPCDPACAAAAADAASLLASLGHEVEEATPPYPMELIQSVMRVVMNVPVAAEVDGLLREMGRDLRDDDLEPFTRVLYDMASVVTGTELVDALHDVERVGWVFGPFFETYDVLVTPTLPVAPPALGVLDTTDVEAMYRHAGQVAALTGFCNVTGQPAISLPLGRFDDGVPLGVQLVAGVGREDLLLRLAAELEAAAPWPVTAVTF